jgi:hypothetical protein
MWHTLHSEPQNTHDLLSTVFLATEPRFFTPMRSAKQVDQRFKRFGEWYARTKCSVAFVTRKSVRERGVQVDEVALEQRFAMDDAAMTSASLGDTQMET